MIKLLRAAADRDPSDRLTIADPESDEDVVQAILLTAKEALPAMQEELHDASSQDPILPKVIGLRPSDRVVILDILRVPVALRGSGIGGFLLAALEDWGQQRGATAVLLHAGNMETGGGAPTPIPFYRKHGYAVLDQLGLVALMAKRLDGKPLDIDPVHPSPLVPEPERGELPPELPAALLRHLQATAEVAFPGYDDEPCAVMSDALDKEARTFGLQTYVSNGGARLDESHVYVVLRSRDPRWDFTILDPSVRQYLDAPKASSTQQALAAPYPRHPAAPALAIVPPGHPFYARLGYNPDPNVGTVEDPGGGTWRGGRFPSGDWRPSADHRLWRMWDPEREIYYPLEPGVRGKRPSDMERITMARQAVRAMIERIIGKIRSMEFGESRKYLQEGLDQKDFKRSDLRQLSREARLPILGTGASRVVFDFGRGRALKIAWTEENQACNVSEADTWQNAPPYVRSRLVPILDGDFRYGTYLIMPVVRPHNGIYDGEAVLLAAGQDLYKRVRQADAEFIYLPGIDDLDSGRNWAWHRGRLKALDYAGAECVK